MCMFHLTCVLAAWARLAGLGGLGVWLPASCRQFRRNVCRSLGAHAQTDVARMRLPGVPQVCIGSSDGGTCSKTAPGTVSVVAGRRCVREWQRRECDAFGAETCSG